MSTPLIIPDTEQSGVSVKAMHWKWIYLAASVSAWSAALIFLTGIIGLANGDNWLITIIRLLAGSPGVQLRQLYQLNALDLVLLALITIVQVGLYAALQRSHRVLTLIALVQPPLGFLLFLLTHNAGRSAVMGAGLVISVAMLRGGAFTKWIGWIGLLSNALLFAGDVGASLAPCSPLAITTGLGYILLIGWLLAIGRRLLQLARSGMERKQ